MSQGPLSRLVATSLAVFSMFFGAGNLMFAINVGRQYQSQTPLALLGFLSTAVGLPLLGIVSMLLYDGDHKAFFDRGGKHLGPVLLAASLTILAPMIAMPRIVALLHTMLLPYVTLTAPVFTGLFLLLTFVCTVTKERILPLLGYWISPALILSLFGLLIIAAFSPLPVQPSAQPAAAVVVQNALYGYNTLDLIAAVYFGSMVAKFVRQQSKAGLPATRVQTFGILSSCLGLLLLTLSYVGLAYLGAKATNPDDSLNEGEVLGYISRHLLGHWGGLVFMTVVATACLSTIIALASLFADYLCEFRVTRHKMSYPMALAVTLGFTGLIANTGLAYIIRASAPILVTIYPPIIALTTVNFLQKTYGFKPVKIIVLPILIMSIYFNFGAIMSIGFTVNH